MAKKKAPTPKPKPRPAPRPAPRPTPLERKGPIEKGYRVPKPKPTKSK